MKKTCYLLFAFVLAMSATAQADVTLTFDSNTQGFSTSFGNGNVAWSSEHGGSLQFNNTSSGWSNPIGVLSMTSSPELTAEFNLLMANGGTLTFDYIIRQEDIGGYDPGNPPGWFELVATGNSDSAVGGGWDQNVIGGDPGYYGGIPSGWTTKQVTLGLAAGAPVANNGIVTWGVGSGWNELMIGVNSPGGSFTNATFYIDNLTVSAIPEPGSLVVLAISGCALVLRRRR